MRKTSVEKNPRNCFIFRCFYLQKHLQNCEMWLTSLNTDAHRNVYFCIHTHTHMIAGAQQHPYSVHTHTQTRTHTCVFQCAQKNHCNYRAAVYFQCRLRDTNTHHTQTHVCFERRRSSALWSLYKHTHTHICIICLHIGPLYFFSVAFAIPASPTLINTLISGGNTVIHLISSNPI